MVKNCVKNVNYFTNFRFVCKNMTETTPEITELIKVESILDELPETESDEDALQPKKRKKKMSSLDDILSDSEDSER